MSFTQLETKFLFGGAISLDLPAEVIDASDLRQIPDNQEVFLFPDSDTSISLEVLELVTEGLAKTDLWEAAKFHFGSLAHDNSSLESTILTNPPSDLISFAPQSTDHPSTPIPVSLMGTQRIHKFSYNPTGGPRPGHESDMPDDVYIFLALWRVWLEDVSKEGKAKKKADVVLSVNVNQSAKDQSGERERDRVGQWFTKTMESLQIIDYGLFGDAK
ncbi:hypothetical protein L204_104808 [Cryptococcus depauperatus]|nr:hypothetical protein L204_05312 [Cryptococcus depauperatus CBS 7855]